ncbi:MAG: DUF6090 family protein [Gammaproteobacteria bacterium]|nr:DUF6090 family protein [Gammaproteobacteria bacterium]
MIGFFRKARLYLLSDNRFSTYLIYALGEIILVVAGIMIALQINNWNERRISVQKEIVILEEIHQDLVGDLENQIEPCIARYTTASELFDSLQSDYENSSAAASDDSVRGKYIRVILPWYLTLNTAAFDNLVSNGSDLITNDSLRRDISSFYGYEYKVLDKYHTYTEQWFRTDILPLLSDNVNMFEPLSEPDLEFLRDDIRMNTRLVSYVTRNRQFRDRLLVIKPKLEQLALDIQHEIGRLEQEY